jgi:hypothetical protein
MTRVDFAKKKKSGSQTRLKDKPPDLSHHIHSIFSIQDFNKIFIPTYRSVFQKSRFDFHSMFVHARAQYPSFATDV